MAKSIVVLVSALLCAVPVAAGAARKDRDHDHLPDRWERKYHLSTHIKSGRYDPDHDGLRNRGEYKHRTNPRKRDTDGDGYGDLREIRAGTNPRKKRSRPRRRPTPPSGGFPTPFNTGVPGGWKPKSIRSGRDLEIKRAGAVIEDLQVDNADVYVLAPNVTLRRVRIRGGRLLNASGPDCAGQGMVVEDSTIEPPPGQSQPSEEPYVVGEGGYTLRRVKIWNVGDGPRISYRPEGCGAVTIKDTFISVTQAGHEPWHTDGIQAYYGGHLNIDNVTIDARGDHRFGTSAAFFYPNQNNTSATINRLLLYGGAYSFRLGEPGTVTGLRIVQGSWIFGPIDVKCSVVSKWDAAIVTATSAYQPARTLRRQRCNTDGGD